MATHVGTITVEVKIIGIGGKYRLRFLCLIAKLLGITLEAKVKEE